MNAEHRQILREKRLVLEKTIKLDETLIKYLREYKLFNQSEDIKSITDVLDLLPTRGPNAFDKFIEILKKGNYVDEDFLKAAILSPNLFYKMSVGTSGYCGYCLIINNVEFEINEYFDDVRKENPCRHGSDIDAESLRDFFERNEFHVTVKNNLKAETMEKAIAQFSEKEFDDVDSMILIILSHGGRKGSRDILFGTDWKYIYKFDILSYFDNNENPGLKLKPKIFIFNACRGRSMDYGVPKTSPSSKESLDAAPMSLYISTLSDIFVVHSCLPNQVSVLNKAEGSFFCSTLVSVLNEYYKVHDLETMIKLVNLRLEEKVSQEYRVVQSAHVETLGWKKMIMLRPSLCSLI